MTSTANENRVKTSLFAFYVRLVFMALVVLLGFSCATQKKTGSAYYEDLSANRPKYNNVDEPVRKNLTSDPAVKTVTPTKNVNAKVDAVLDSIDRFNLTKKFVDGYTIQVYSGQKKDDAMDARQKMDESVADMTANLQYIQPKFRVTVGSYFTKLEAQKDLMRLKRIFSNAILVPEKILIR